MTQKTLNIATVAAGVISVAPVGLTIYQAAANAMDAVEALGVLTGVAKKQAVLAFIKGLVDDWDVYEKLISTFIDQIKTAYNAVKDLFK